MNSFQHLSMDMLIYEDGSLRVQVRIDGRTVWLTQAGIASLFQTTPQNITMHLKSIYEEEELNEKATCKEFLQVQQEGSRSVRRAANTTTSTPSLPWAIGSAPPAAQPSGSGPPPDFRNFVVKGFTDG